MPRTRGLAFGRIPLYVFFVLANPVNSYLGYYIERSLLFLVFFLFLFFPFTLLEMASD
jgi:hypothetical protein